ncbi:hypothetical protein D3C77_418900 [compost metagenome]
MGHGGEELVLQTVTVGQLLVEDFQRPSSIAQGLGLLIAHAVDAIGQCQRQQAHLQCRTNLAGVHGQEHIGQVAQHHQGVEQTTEQEGRPGNDEVTRHPQATPPGVHPGGEDSHGEQQGQDSCQAQRNAVTADQRQQHDQAATGHQHLEQAIKGTTVLGHLQETTGELATKQSRCANEQWRRCVRPPGIIRPEVGDTGAVDGHLVKAEGGDIENVIEVTGVAHAEVDEQVVDQHPQQHAIDQAEDIQSGRLRLQIGIGGPQGQRRLHRTLTVQA